VRLELISDPEQGLPDPLGRKGMVHITNNQRSADPNRFLVLRPSGRCSTATRSTPPARTAHGPDVWTDAPVEIVDRSNLPRRPGTAAAVAPGNADEDTPHPAAVAEVLGGQRLPPPTVTAVGMRVYLEPDNRQDKTDAAARRSRSEGVSRVQRGSARRVARKGGDEPVGRGGDRGWSSVGGQSGVIAEPPAAAAALAGG
jgi:hypothetical protein